MVITLDAMEVTAVDAVVFFSVLMLRVEENNPFAADPAALVRV